LAGCLHLIGFGAPFFRVCYISRIIIDIWIIWNI